MRKQSSDAVLESLHDLIDRSSDGERLPTVRDLMRDHRVSQAAVTAALDALRGEGLVSSHVGRGSYVVKREGHAPDGAMPRTLLILSNASMNERGVMVQNRLVDEMAAEGGKVVQISYHDTDQLLAILDSTPRFDAAILQSHFESIPVRLLTLLKAKSKALVADGHSISGIDVDRVGTDWEEALDMAVSRLADLGHARIALISADIEAQPILSARRAFVRIARAAGIKDGHAYRIVLPGMTYPNQRVADRLERALGDLIADSGGRLPFTGAVFLGQSDGAGLRDGLGRLGLRVPEELSVCLLGHRDVPSEHQEVLTMAGSTASEAAAALLSTLRRRLEDPGAPPRIVFLGVDETVRASVATQPASRAG
jgi:DNA-binding LacI/PurR family transcriptional regulator